VLCWRVSDARVGLGTFRSSRLWTGCDQHGGRDTRRAGEDARTARFCFSISPQWVAPRHTPTEEEW